MPVTPIFKRSLNQRLKRWLLAFAVLAPMLALSASSTFSNNAVPSRATQTPAPAPPGQPRYETRANHDPNGTAKFYMGREIAQVMGPGGMDWLDRPEREQQENPAKVMDALELHSGDVAADLGAGTGYFTFRMAPVVGPTGRVLAVDIQDEMLNALRKRASTLNVSNVEVIKASETDPHLPANAVDLVLFVDVYHELSYPFEVMSKVRDSLKPGGRVVFVEYRKEDPQVPIKEVHKMSVKQLESEMNVVGLVRVRTVETLPLQHIVIFKKRN